MENKKISREIQDEIDKITKKIKNVDEALVTLFSLFDKYKIELLKVRYKPGKLFNLTVKRLGKEEVYNIKWSGEIDKNQKEFIYFLAELNKNLRENGKTDWSPEIHLSYKESTKHHAKEFWKNAEDTYNKILPVVLKNYKGELYRDVLVAI